MFTNALAMHGLHMVAAGQPSESFRLPVVAGGVLAALAAQPPRL